MAVSRSTDVRVPYDPLCPVSTDVRVLNDPLYPESTDVRVPVLYNPLYVVSTDVRVLYDPLCPVSIDIRVLCDPHVQYLLMYEYCVSSIY
jgi:hypothetical protein